MLSQSNAFPNDSTINFSTGSVGSDLSNDLLQTKEQVRRRVSKAYLRSTGESASGSDGTTGDSERVQRTGKRRLGIVKIAGISVGSVAAAAGVTHMNEVLTLAKDWGPGTIVVILAFLLLFNVPIHWSKYKNDQEDRQERKDLYTGILDMQGKTVDAISGLSLEVRANTGKIDQLILVMSSRACITAAQQGQIQSPIVAHVAQQHQQHHNQHGKSAGDQDTEQPIDHTDHESVSGSRRKRT